MEKVRNPEKDLGAINEVLSNINGELGNSELDMLEALPWYIQQYQLLSEQLQEHQTKPEYELGYIDGSNATFQRVKDLLKQLEWSASEEQWDEDCDGDSIYSGTISVCPICGCYADYNSNKDSHSADCTLAKLLYSHGETEVSK